MSADRAFDAIAAADPVPADSPRGWIQYKGTDICVDLHCACGTHGHYDGDQMYFVRCKDCGRRYGVSQNVLLVELTDDVADAAEVDWRDRFIGFSESDG